MRIKVVNAKGTLLSAVALLLLLAGDAPALPLVVEMHELRPDLGPISRDVYLCEACTLEQFAAIVEPEGWSKTVPRVGLWSSAVSTGPPDNPGVPLTREFVAEIPGEEFTYVARVVDAALVGIVDGSPLVLAHVQRNTVHTFDAGSVIHEVIDDVGNRYVAFTFDQALSESTYDVEAVGAFAGLPLAAGWTYESRVLTEALVMDSGGLATVFNQGGFASYQRYLTVPEARPLALMLAALATAGTGRRRRPGRRWLRERAAE
jgi:hypothetical protein